ncbi:MAG: hypothetical protein WAK96_03165, partial [Desulfobaccales bacterium]
LIFVLNRRTFNNVKVFIKGYLFTLMLCVVCSLLFLLGLIYTHYVYIILNYNMNFGVLFIKSLPNLRYMIYCDWILLVIIPSLIIAIYTFNAETFKISCIRSSISSMTIFLTSDIISIICNKVSPRPREILFYLVADIFGGIIFGYVIARSLSYLKRKLYDPSFGNRAIVIKYNNLLLTIAISSILLYFLFFYRTYNPFSLIVNDYDVLSFQYYNTNEDQNVTVQIPISSLLLKYEGELPFSFDWENSDKEFYDKNTCVFIAKYNIEKYSAIFQDKELFNKLFANPTKEDIKEIFNIYYTHHIKPGKISILGDPSVIFVSGDKNLIIEMALPYAKHIGVYKDITRHPMLTDEAKRIFGKIIGDNKILSFFIAKGNIVQLKGFKILALYCVDINKNGNNYKDYIFNLPHQREVLNVPINENNPETLLMLGDNTTDKDILLSSKNIYNGFGMQVDSHSLLYDLFKGHFVKDLEMSNIKGKLNYMYKETDFKHNDNVTIFGEGFSISQLTQDALTVTGRSRNIIINNEEMGSSMFSSLGGDIKGLAEIVMMICAILTFVFAFTSYGKNMQEHIRKKIKKNVRKKRKK